MRLLFTHKLIKKFVIIWLAYWLGVMGFNIYFLKPLGISFIENTHWLICYFLVFALIAPPLFSKIGGPVTLPKFKKQIVCILISGMVFWVLSEAVKNWISLNPIGEQSLRELSFYYPILLTPTIWGKFADILFQQTLIVIIVLFLKKHCPRPRDTIEIFTFLFFTLHIPLLHFFGWAALMFIFPSLVAGTVFSFLISRYSWGATLSVLVHEIYYLVIAVILRISPLQI